MLVVFEGKIRGRTLNWLPILFYKEDAPPHSPNGDSVIRRQGSCSGSTVKHCLFTEARDAQLLVLHKFCAWHFNKKKKALSMVQLAT